MPRRYYRRSRTIVRAPRKKWGSNLAQGSFDSSTTSVVLVANTPQTNVPTPAILKAGNFKIQGDIMLRTTGNATLAALPRFNVYVYYLPEGVTLTTLEVAAKHPEWLLAWKQMDVSGHPGSTSNVIVNGSAFSISSRLKRNLNSGDQIVMGIAGSVQSTAFDWAVNYTVQYWTCSN